jgi:curli biogenesis system outer membrane secretion channel CsgG
MKPFIVTILLFLPALIFSKGKETLAVWDLKAQGADVVITAVLSGKLRAELFDTGHYDVMSRDEMGLILKKHQIEPDGVCEDTTCLARAGKALGVVYMVTGVVTKAGTVYSITLIMVSVGKTTKTKIATELFQGPDEGLVGALKKTVKKMLVSPPSAKP